jgi:hypothetical protein
MKFLIGILFVMIAAATAARGASLSGYVVDDESGEPLIGASVAVAGQGMGAYTNKSGFFSIKDIPGKKLEIKVAFVGYETASETIDFSTDKSVRRTFRLEQTSVDLGEVTVEAMRDMDRREITISKINVPVEQIKQISVGGETDVFRSLQFLPGILTSSQLSSGLFVRGGSPDQNLVLVDGSAVYNPTHLFGFISTFNSEAIKDVDLIKGGFPAEYGGRLSAVLNITQKEGNKKEFEGVGKIGVISSSASMEGPIGNGSWLLSGRRTYFELIKEVLPEDPEEPLPDFNFYDINAKITQNLSKDDKIFLSGFASADNLAYGSYGLEANLSIANKLLSARWNHVISDDMFTVLNVSGSRYDNEFIGDLSGYEFLINNSISDITIKGSLEWFTSDILTHKFGFESTKFTFDYLQNFTGDTDSTQSGSSGATTNLTIDDWNHSLFMQINYNPFELTTVQAGFRGSYFQLADHFTVDPRLAVKYRFLDNFSMKAAFGVFHQNLRLATQPDFSFFDTWLPTDSTLPVSRAIHYILSAEYNPTDDLNMTFDVYYKEMQHVSELNRTALRGSVVSDIFYTGESRAYGGEIFIQRRYGKLTGWLGYAYGFITAQFDSINGGDEFRPKYDRRHDLKFVLQYDYDDNWDFGLTFTFQSGQSYTGASSQFHAKLPGQRIGRGKIMPTQRYGLRLPPSHQLNLNASYAFDLWGLRARAILDVFNVYNRRDIWFRYYNTREDEIKVEDVRLIPILPTLSFEARF